MLILLGFAFEALSQTPVSVKVSPTSGATSGFSTAVCPPGVTAFAGTSTQSLFASAQSNDIEFLCINDSMNVEHQGGQPFGDPDVSTAPGITYAFYTCPPTVMGPDFNSVNADPCQLNTPPPPGGAFYTVQSNIDINGNATFFNNGTLQTLSNGGNPMEVYFAPVTIDDWATFTYENDGAGGPPGPCIHANTADAFRVVYLNEIQATNINTAAAGACTGSFTIEGGLPEFDGSIYTNVSVVLSTDPNITGTLISNPGSYTHGDEVTFVVPTDGIYNITIEDGKSCEATFTMDMGACPIVTFDIGDMVTGPGSTVCVPITAENFNNMLSFQFSINFDPAELIFQSVNPVMLPDFLASANPFTGVLTFSWTDVSFTGQTFSNTDVLFEICFDVLGPVGSSADVIFSDTPTPVEVTDIDGLLGYILTDGGVVVSTNAFTIDFGVCGTLTNTGSFTVSAIGGTAPYNVGWVQQGNPGNSGTTTIPIGLVENLVPGTYDVVVTDAMGNIVNASVVIPNIAPLFAQTTFTNPTCQAGMDGSVTLNFGDGVAPYEIVWNTGATGVSTLNGLSEGNYAVTVTDDLGCSVSSAQSLTAPALDLNLDNLQNVSCINGPNSGSITVAASGDNPPFTYLWDNGATTPNINNLTAGEYCVAATDANGCVISGCWAVNEPVPPSISSFDSVSVACPNEMTGALTVNVTPGGAVISSYQWDDPAMQTTQTASNLSAGTYSVTVTDDVGCSAVGTATLYAPAPMSISETVTPPDCPSFNTGTIQLMISGGTIPYDIQWENGNTFPVHASLLCDSTYSVTVSDANNCETIELEIEVPCPPSIVVTVDAANIQAVSCNGGIPCDGQATVLASGGTAGTGIYNFTWSSGETDMGVSQSTATQLCQGEQTVVVDDGICPSEEVSISIPAPDPLGLDLANTSSSSVSCFGLSDGSAMVAGSGGTAGYTYQWASPAVMGPMISDVPAGIYMGTITDANGCTQPFQIEIGQPEPLVATIDSAQTTSITCAGGEDGQVAVFWTGGNPGPATYTWSPDVSTNALATGLGVGTYSVTVTDQNGCSDDAQYTLTEPTPITAVVPPPVEPLCNGGQTVVTVESATGGASLSHTFSVDFGPPQFLTSSIPILAGEHTIQIFDSLGCFTEYEIVVGEPAPVIVDLGDDIVLELGDSVQLKPIIIVQDIPIDTILWDPLTNFNCEFSPVDSLCKRPWVSPLETTLYELTVVDTNGCLGTDEIIIEIDRNRNVYIPNAFSPDGNGVNDIFKIYTGIGVSKINYFKIYDRWGEQLYEESNFLPGDNYLDGWDGRFNGKAMNSGVYVYMAEVVFVDGQVLLYRGDVTLVR